MAKMIDHQKRLASRGFTQGILGISEYAYYKKSKAERLKLRRKAYNKFVRINKGLPKKVKEGTFGYTKKRRRKKKKGFFARLFG